MCTWIFLIYYWCGVQSRCCTVNRHLFPYQKTLEKNFVFHSLGFSTSILWLYTSMYHLFLAVQRISNKWELDGNPLLHEKAHNSTFIQIHSLSLSLSFFRFQRSLFLDIPIHSQKCRVKKILSNYEKLWTELISYIVTS